MAWTTLAGFYIVLWWIVLFAILPFGVRSQAESGDTTPGTDPGAPTTPSLRQKVVWTTIVSLVIFLLFYAAYAANLIDGEKFATVWGLYPR